MCQEEEIDEQIKKKKICLEEEERSKKIEWEDKMLIWKRENTC